MADYRYDTLAQQDVEWTSGAGNALKVSISLVQESMDYFGNGEYTPTRGGLNIRMDTHIDGAQDRRGTWIKELSEPRGAVVASIGKIGLSAERVSEIRAAETEIESHPAWQAKMEKQAKAENESWEYEQHKKAVDDMMTLGGKTY